MKNIILNVCQGVGDIFWVYQKFSPHVDKIQFFVSHVPKGDYKVQNRATDFLRLLPKVDNVVTRQVSCEEYDNIAHSYFPIQEIIERVNNESNGPFDYACNLPLEQGIRIEDIDSEFSFEETVKIMCVECPLAFEPGEFISVYVSGSTKNPAVLNMGIWSIDMWFEFIKEFYAKYLTNNVPIILIGAFYDKDVLLALEKKLNCNGFKVHTYIDAWAANITYILKNSICFLGYQSGLSVLADNLDVPQVMLYFPFLDKMLYTWCKKSNMENGIFNSDIFTHSPKEVIKNLKLEV